MTLTLTGDALEALQEAIDKQAASIAGARLYTGTAAINDFNLTRATLRHIPETRLPGRSKPLYSAAAIVSYLKTCERN